MDCPRCGGVLATFAVEATGESAVVCDSCGFVGVAASHEQEESNVESWDQAIERFEAAGVPLDRTRQVRRADAVSVPTSDSGSGSGVDADTFEESVTVAAALRGDDGPEPTESGGSEHGGDADGSDDSSDRS
jgi:transcription initiation factor TFIIIB Brf1 subunit/transcription initiation factor TFIIB